MRDDFELMQGVADGDPAAVAELYDRFGALVYRMAYQFLPSRADAEDAVQEVFVRLWKSADRYDPGRATLVTWVMLITRRYLVDQLRRARSRLSPSEFDESWSAFDPEAGPPEKRLLREERFEKLRMKIEALPDLQREVVERAYLGGKTLREIAQELEKPIGTIKSALSRALAGLRERVPPDHLEG
ncbi:MAG: RNA polymerase sigma factor [Phycisphaerales bacterium]